jgi:lipoyl(octanoyl) transferase
LKYKKNHKVFVHDLGLIDYKKAWDYQEVLFQRIIQEKLINRERPFEERSETTNYLLICQHPHVYTLGKSGNSNNLLINESELRRKGAAFYHINRGGDITYHGPGQIVGYPIIDLDNFTTDIHKYLRFLEEALIRTLKEYGIHGGRIPGLTGVWLDHEQKSKARKICAIGVKTSRWVTMHGFAFNVNTDLDYFNNIVPCGINDKAVTSLSRELQKPIQIEEVEEKIKKNIAAVFDMKLIDQKPEIL